MEGKAGVKWKWWLLTCILLVAGLVGPFDLKPREYEFIAKYRGVKTGIPVRNGASRIDSEPYGATYYGFKVDPNLVAAEVEVEAKKRGWTESPVDQKSLHPYSDWNQRMVPGEKRETMVLVPAHPEDSFTFYVVLTHNRSWLDRQWSAVKKWFGR